MTFGEIFLLSEVHRDIKQLMRKYAEHGWSFEMKNNSHIVGTHKNGARVSISGTPSDHRTVKNVESVLKNPDRHLGTGRQSWTEYQKYKGQ